MGLLDMDMEKCKLCGSCAQPLPLKKKYHICLHCQLIWLDNSHLLSPQAERERYRKHNNDLNNPGYTQMFRDFLDLVEPHSQGMRALDFGSGPSPVLAEILGQRGWNTEIYDPYFAPDFSFAGKEFDLITCTEVVEHIADPWPVWQLLTKCLAARGILAVMTRLHSGPDQFRDWWYIRDTTHVCFYSRVTMEWLAVALGLKIIYCRDNIIVFSLN